jgi:hypothetical protein
MLLLSVRVEGYNVMIIVFVVSCGKGQVSLHIMAVRARTHVWVICCSENGVTYCLSSEVISSDLFSFCLTLYGESVMVCVSDFFCTKIN